MLSRNKVAVPEGVAGIPPFWCISDPISLIDEGYLALLLLLYFIYFLGELAQLARAPALHAGGHRFDSDILH